MGYVGRSFYKMSTWLNSQPISMEILLMIQSTWHHNDRALFADQQNTGNIMSISLFISSNSVLFLFLPSLLFFSPVSSPLKSKRGSFRRKCLPCTRRTATRVAKGVCHCQILFHLPLEWIRHVISIKRNLDHLNKFLGIFFTSTSLFTARTAVTMARQAA